jgi:hypothetical protein
LADETKDLGFDPNWKLEPPKLEFDRTKRYADKFGAVWYWSGKTWGNHLREVLDIHETPPDKYAPYSLVGDK